MFSKAILLGSITASALLGLLFSAAPAVANIHDQILAHQQSLVTVKFVLKVKMEGMGSDRDLDGEITCALIGTDGLVLCSNTELGGYVAVMGRLMGGGAGLTMSAQPTALEVHFEAGGEGHAARLLTRDSDRDLAWLTLDAPPEQLPPALDFATAASLAPGDRFFALRRMAAFFGRAPLVIGGTVAGLTDRPRRLAVPSAELNAGFGAPVFEARGRLAGITVLQMPGIDDQPAGMFDDRMSFLGASSKLQDMAGGLILPAAEVAKATRLAREIAAEEAAAE